MDTPDPADVQKPHESLRASVVIPTYERPRELADALASVREQSRLPDEVIVIDDGELDAIPHRESLESAGVAVRYERKAEPGVTESRNRGIEVASSEVVFFSEDDVVLEPDYIEAIMRVFEADAAGDIGGVGGLVVNARRGRFQGLLRLAIAIPLGISPLREGRIKRSGCAGEYGDSLLPVRELTEVDFLDGGVAAFRRSAIAETRFSKRYRGPSGYGQGEDKDFSTRVRRRHRLVVEPAARLWHYPAQKHRFDLRAKGRAQVLYRYYFFRDHLLERWWHWLPFGYSMAGLVVFRLLVLGMRFSRGERDRVLGIIEGLRSVMGRGGHGQL